MTVSGSCPCGGLAYTADDLVSSIFHCHCETCCKAHGSAVSSVATVPKASFRWQRGEDLKQECAFSPGKTRYFCGRCGSHIVAELLDAKVMLLRMGCVNADPEVHSAAHIWRSDAACWYDPAAELPELPEGVETV